MQFFVIVLVLIIIAYVFASIFKLTDVKIIFGFFVLIDILFYYFDIISEDIAAIGFLVFAVMIYFEVSKGRVRTNEFHD